ncbi:ABC transporter G family member 31-like [Hibiscus syriacus]|uniref:ABC transporter G family member 31-like n=1 Tax=Hibiscus syriacus TaxID=106335 RepID=A0A6A2YXV4_HIBSY|nr:ABC transporter G family member 31-like [Hibiscus syriacus]
MAEPRRPSGSSNFYHVLEDMVHERLTGKVAWTVHRPGLLMGGSNRALFNFIGSLCVYGAICKHLNLPSVFGGTRECWEESYIDGSDARLVAEQQIWAVATACSDGECSSYGQAFNAINGSSFTWKEMWPILGEKFGVGVAEEMFVVRNNHGRQEERMGRNRCEGKAGGDEDGRFGELGILRQVV